MRRAKHLEVMSELLAVEGMRLLDVGCGDGSLSRRLAKLGAAVTGLEISTDKVALAAAKDNDGLATYVEGGAESLPFDDGAFDGIIFFNSLHHVPNSLMARGLGEAARCLKPDGLLYVCEPVAIGPHFELCQPVDDETEVRAAAQDELDRLAPPWHQVERVDYLTESLYADFDAFRKKVIQVDPGRRDRFDALQDDLRSQFEATGQPHPKGVSFDQPMTVRLFVKATP